MYAKCQIECIKDPIMEEPVDTITSDMAETQDRHLGWWRTITNQPTLGSQVWIVSERKHDTYNDTESYSVFSRILEINKGLYTRYAKQAGEAWKN